MRIQSFYKQHRYVSGKKNGFVLHFGKKNIFNHVTFLTVSRGGEMKRQKKKRL